MRNRGAKKPLTPSQQYLLLKNNPLCPGNGEVRSGKLKWSFQCQSNPHGRIYTIEIQFAQGASPDVFVREPDIQLLAGDRDIPHTYHDPLRLCLYLPGTCEWHPTLRIDYTIVPWVSLWLYYFEEWLESNDWKGGGQHPDAENDNSGNRASRRMTSQLRSSMC